MSGSGSEVDWMQRSKDTLETVKQMRPKLDKWIKSNRDKYQVVSYFEDYPPRFMFFVTFYGVNFVTRMLV